MGPGPPPLGPWGASRGVPGGGSRPNVCGPEVAEPSWFWHRFLWRFWHRFLIVLGSIWAPSWGSFSVVLAPWSAKVGPKTVLNRLNIEKVNFHETSAGVVPERLQGPKMAPKTAPDRPKTGPRSSWIVFLAPCFFAWILGRVRFVLVPFWVPKCPPKG